jgi:hypothetical protein
MKKLLLVSLATLLIAAVSFAQTTADKLYQHSGKVLEVKIIKVGELSISYKYPGEDAEQVIGKLAVSKIVFSSGRTEEISEKISVSSQDDWENVQIITDKSQVVGLKAGEEVGGKTAGFITYNSAGSADKKATKKIKEAAAEMGAQFILMTSDKSDGFGAKQAMKKGVTYSYK